MKAQLKKFNFSKPQLLVFALVFGLLGIIAWHSFAANPNLQGDLNNDNTVNISDLSILLTNYGTTNTVADINSDGTVNITDLSILLSHYGSSYVAPNSTKLMWAPPALTNPITINAPASGPWQPQLNAGQDYIIKMPGTAMVSNSTNGSPGIVLNGGRNIVIIGGELYRPNTVPPGTTGDAIGIEIAEGVTGTVHIEGMYIHGMWGQGIQFAMQSATTHPEVQIENTRIEAMHPTQYPGASVPANAEIHTDAIQSYGGPYKLRLDHVTLRTTGTGLQIQPHNLQTASPVGTWEFNHVDVVQTTGQYGNYALWKNFDQPQNWPIVQSDLYVSNQAYLAWANEDNYPIGWNRWNPGGGWPVTGEAWNVGLRPGGDLVLSTSVGLGYASPGYQ